MITIHLNGESREVPEGLTLGALLDRLTISRDRVAVERNLEIIHRDAWDRTPVENGDRLEVVHFVGGGTGSDASSADIVAYSAIQRREDS